MALTPSAATIASWCGVFFSGEIYDTLLSLKNLKSFKEMKDSLAEAEEKYREALTCNAQLHSEKLTLIYQIETLREELSDMEELLWEAQRQYDDRGKEIEQERQAHNILQFQLKEIQETLKHAEELFTVKDDDKITQELASRQAEECPYSSLEMKNRRVVEEGKLQEQQPLEGKCCKICKLFLTHVKTIEKKAKDFQGNSGNHTGRNKVPQEPPTNQECDIKLYTREFMNVLFGYRERNQHILAKMPERYESKSRTHTDLCGMKAVKDTLEIQEKTPDDSKPTKSFMILPFVPSDLFCQSVMCHLGESMLEYFVKYYPIISKITGNIPFIPEPLNWWVLELEYKLKNVAKHVLNKPDDVDKESIGTAGCKLLLKDLPEGPNKEGLEN